MTNHNFSASPAPCPTFEELADQANRGRYGDCVNLGDFQLARGVKKPRLSSLLCPGQNEVRLGLFSAVSSIRPRVLCPIEYVIRV